MKHYKNILVGLFLVSLLAIATFSTWIYSQIDSALPVLDGKQTLFGLSASVTVERDKQGIVTIIADNRSDIALATGFVHAQERFFQMDLLRRNSAGELSSLFGEVALAYDTDIRRHRFRDRAAKIIKQLPANDMKLLKAYTRGVNQGLNYLKAEPFEYLLLGQAPVEWQEEDTILAVLSMYIDLQYSDGKRERTLGLLKSVLSPDVFQFLNPKGSKWDAAIDNSQYPQGNLPTKAWPSPADIALMHTNIASAQIASHQPSASAEQNSKYQHESFPGSNNWAVAGSISQTGAAIVANDMHLGIRVPNTWFRASFEYKDKDKQRIKVTGATLPGTPNIIIGSNENIAWGFTNSYGDWSDVIILETNDDKSEYLTPNGYRAFSKHKQIIAVKDQDAVEITVQDTIWGPVIGTNAQGQLLAYRWIAHDTNAVNLQHSQLETAKNVEQAFAIATRAGMPAQNLMVGDNKGNIGWTIMGPIPKKSGNFGDTPTSWANGENRWLGMLAPEDYPRVKNPVDARLWSANSRVVGGEMLAKIGNGGYAVGARSQQIKQNLFAKENFDEKTLLAIALDDRAIFLQRWQEFLLTKVMTPEQLAIHPQWQTAKTFIMQSPLTASVDSVGYRIVRNFRIALRDQLFSIFNEKMSALDEHYAFHTIRHQIEAPLWTLVNQQPENFLWRPNESWSALFAQTLQSTLNDMSDSQSLAEATWGQLNVSEIVHPLSNAVPFIGRWLDMPKIALPGDSHMPRVQGKAFGASERMVVSPGHEEQGIFHMPTSQSGHPWSPYYGLGHSDWQQGNPSSFLPGKTKYTLTLLNY